MKLEKIEDVNLYNQRVLVRVDFNVAVEDGKIKERFKIEASKKTINHILGENAKVALITHLGRPGGMINLDLSLEQIAGDIEKVLERKVKFNPNCIGGEVKAGMDNLEYGEVLLLENVRFHEEERNNDKEFAELLAENFNVFVNDAFSVSHRDHASVTGVAKILPSYAGMRLRKEIENMDKVKNNPEHPATAIIGGAKIKTKLPIIENLEKNYDNILVGGRVAVEAIEQKMNFSEKVLIAWDFAENNLDIGPESISKFAEIILQSKTVVWNGPMGKFEQPPYDKGTRELLNVITGSGAFSLVGGGESVQFLEESGLFDKISFVSTGGGAMLEYLSGGEMPGLETLKGD